MKKHSVFAVALVGMFMASTNGARADFGTASIVTPNVINGTATSGSWHVIVSNAGPGNVWNVTAFADSLASPNASVEHIQIGFFSSSFDAQTAQNALAIISSGDLSDGFLTPGPINWTGGAEVGGGATNKQFNSDGSNA